ncbi:MAG TPA: hypothetical protein VL020_00320 [Pseudomonadales bacterium]|nr:hypothetical protein [Pseudomonadales bacterium]
MSLKEIEKVLENNAAASWERLRGSDELLGFISRREQALEFVEVEDFAEL